MRSTFVTSLLAIMAFTAVAQSNNTHVETIPAKNPKFYTSGGFDGGIFSINTSNSGTTNIPRFSWFVNTGIFVNRDFNNHFGLFTGLSVKNLGFIEKYRDANNTMLTVKRRTYDVGIPLGLKFGNLSAKGTFVTLGGGIDFPVQYKEKVFTGGRKNKAKETEWFSEEVTPVMPYVFAGVCFKSNFTVKFQYYMNNFMNDDLLFANGSRVYSYDTKLGMLSLSWYTRNKGKKSMKENFKSMMKQKSTATNTI